MKSTGNACETKNLANELRYNSLFSELSSSEIIDLLPVFKLRLYRRNQIICNDEASFFYIVLDGRVKLSLFNSQGKEILLALKDGGSHFGEASLLYGCPFPVNASALDHSNLLRVSKSNFDRHLMLNPKISQKLIKRVCQDLQEYTHIIEVMSHHTVEKRLLSALDYLLSRYGKKNSKGETFINLNLNQLMLAQMIGVCRESLARFISIYRSLGYLEIRKGKIYLLKLEEIRSHLAA